MVVLCFFWVFFIVYVLFRIPESIMQVVELIVTPLGVVNTTEDNYMDKYLHRMLVQRFHYSFRHGTDNYKKNVHFVGVVD